MSHQDDHRNDLAALVLTSDQLLSAEIEPIKWLVPNTIPNPGLVAISGRPGNYKTFFAMALVNRLSAGMGLFAHAGYDGDLATPPDSPAPCLFIEQEMSPRQMKSRLEALEECEGANVHWVIGGGVNVRSPSWMEQIEEYVRANDIRVIVLDPFSSVAHMKDENSNAEASRVMDSIRHRFVDSDLECTVIFLHHPSKGDGQGSNLRGAGDILGKCDVHLTLAKTSRESRTVTVRYEKNRNADDSQLSDLQMRFEEGEDGRLYWIHNGVASRKTLPRSESLKEGIQQKLSDGNVCMRKQVAEHLKVSPSSSAFRKAWGELQDTGLIVKDVGGFRWADDDCQDVTL